ncbi:putative disease resistance RPP13-like protein 1 isoform X1 [Arachis hypogaea]|uniref:putative disease resistance RPP13-like protein 1 isoform X1 n=1 Tax=Arachis hypogaea TaxID=3818 RepID=UPI000DECA6F2|nr:putative disease resistance protein At3g14460 [Arachis hypogaea]
MAGALVAGALLSGFINIVINKSLREDVVNRVLGKKLGPGLVERLKISLHAAEAVLDDAEYKQLGDERVRDWLNSLRDAVYDADDFLDSVLTKAATQKEVCSFLPSFFLNRYRKMVDNMEGVVARIEFLVSQKDILGLQKNTKDNNLSSSSSSSSSWRETTCLMEGNIYGREDDQQALIKIINDNSESQLSVIPIVGMGGVGKTTLAKWAYSVAEGFDLKAWICISETFDVAEITRKTVEEITKSSCDLRSLNLLQNELQEILSGKKCFIVLDDVWSEDADKWKQFITPFQGGAKGSTILLTTRNQEVASVVQTCPSCTLNELSEESCWLLFAANACFPVLNRNPTLEDVGRKIVKKCKGLPLAVETLGRLLQGKDDVKEWNVVLMNDIWELKNSKIIPALLISYFQLPPYLKRCFVYCSLFPKDYYFDKLKLILLWMAEDLLRPPKRGESLEEVGSQCFEELASRLFFKPAAKDFPENYVMHDLLHDLAVFLAGDFYCRIEEFGEQEEKKVLIRHLSHLTYGSLVHPISKAFKFIVKSESLRTSLYIDDLLSLKSRASKLKYLRVLSFSKLDVLPDSIGKLIHLRYLNLFRTNVKTLPESLCNLYNLQTLILYECSKLAMLPDGMHKLVKLRHLLLGGTCLKEMPRGISKLKHMHILDYFVVGKHKDNGIQELGGLSNLEGLFEIRKLENVADVRQARSARMLEKDRIDKLLLEWSWDHEMVSNTETERDILDGLQPHNGLKELKIMGYKGERFPDWVGHSSYNNMTTVWLSCKNCCMLPSLGQLPSLKSLRIEGFLELKRIGDEFYKSDSHHDSSPTAPFPSLETLEFHKMPCWEEWHVPDPEAFPQLKILRIERCPMFKGDMLNGIFRRRVSCLSDVSKVEMREDDEAGGDDLSIRGSQSFNARTINHLCCLQELRISGCPSIVSFPGNCIPKSLQKLKLCKCSKLEFPEQQQHKYDLVELQIEESCDSLTSLSLDVFPNLKNLEIFSCRNLESVSISDPPHAALQRLIFRRCSNLVSFAGGLAAPNLTQLTIFDCPELVSFAGEGVAAPNLTHLGLSKCDKLEALPRDMKSLLPSLHSLLISGSDMCWMAEGGLPPNLKSLFVGTSEQQMRDLSWMGNLHALTHLTIYGSYCDNIKSYPEVGSLPHLPSLTTLHIKEFDNLETLECNELLRLTSLQQLHINSCPRLENMEGEKLPPSLLLLKMEYCGLLGEHCKNKHQLIWPKISHIPTIQVDDKQIF